MKKFIKNNLLGFILGGLVFGTAGVLAYSYYANQVSYQTSKNSSVENVQQAVDDLYEKVAAKAPKITHKGIVYLDPTDLSKKCTESDAANNVNANGTPTEIKTGCMKWYIYDDSGDNYKMILDHNTTAIVQWTDKTKIENYMTVAVKVAYSESIIKPYVDALTTTYNWKVTPRLITTEEVNKITGNTAFDVNDDNSHYYFDRISLGTNFGRQLCNDVYKSSYGWLYDYLINAVSNGADYDDNNKYAVANNTTVTTTMGSYWTSDIGPNIEYMGSGVWAIGNGGSLYNAVANYKSPGIRPVIEVPKSSINR